MKYLGLIVAALLLLCLVNMPYGYYELVRFISTMYFIWLAIQSYKEHKENLTFLYGAVALLFQPFLKIALNRTIWNVIDVIIALILAFIFFRNINN